MLIRLEALELAAQAATQDATGQTPLSVIHIAPDGSVTACDGFQLLRLQANVTEPGLFDALLPEEERGYEGDVLVDAGDARDFRAACKKALKRTGKKAQSVDPIHVVVAKVDESLTLATQDGTVERRFVIRPPDEEIKYPNVAKIIPRDADRQITVSVDLMLKLMRTLKKLRVQGVTLGLSKDPMRAISIQARCLAGDLDGALMPMRTDETKSAPDGVDPETGEIHEAVPASGAAAEA